MPLLTSALVRLTARISSRRDFEEHGRARDYHVETLGVFTLQQDLLLAPFTTHCVLRDNRVTRIPSIPSRQVPLHTYYMCVFRYWHSAEYQPGRLDASQLPPAYDHSFRNTSGTPQHFAFTHPPRGSTKIGAP